MEHAQLTDNTKGFYLESVPTNDPIFPFRIVLLFDGIFELGRMWMQVRHIVFT